MEVLKCILKNPRKEVYNFGLLFKVTELKCMPFILVNILERIKATVMNISIILKILEVFNTRRAGLRDVSNFVFWCSVYILINTDATCNLGYYSTILLWWQRYVQMWVTYTHFSRSWRSDCIVWFLVNISTKYWSYGYTIILLQ